MEGHEWFQNLLDNKLKEYFILTAKRHSGPGVPASDTGSTWRLGHTRTIFGREIIVQVGLSKVTDPALYYVPIEPAYPSGRVVLLLVPLGNHEYVPVLFYERVGSHGGFDIQCYVLGAGGTSSYLTVVGYRDITISIDRPSFVSSGSLLKIRKLSPDRLLFAYDTLAVREVEILDLSPNGTATGPSFTPPITDHNRPLAAPITLAGSHMAARYGGERVLYEYVIDKTDDVQDLILNLVLYNTILLIRDKANKPVPQEVPPDAPEPPAAPAAKEPPMTKKSVNSRLIDAMKTGAAIATVNTVEDKALEIVLSKAQAILPALDPKNVMGKETAKAVLSYSLLQALEFVPQDKLKHRDKIRRLLEMSIEGASSSASHELLDVLEGLLGTEVLEALKEPELQVVEAVKVEEKLYA